MTRRNKNQPIEQICDYAKDYCTKFHLYTCVSLEPCDEKVEFERHTYCRFELNRVNEQMERGFRGEC